MIADPKFQEELRRQANVLFHEIVYQTDWGLYPSIRDLFDKLRELPPLTNSLAAAMLKKTLGPKLFTRLKFHYLRSFHKLHLDRS